MWQDMEVGYFHSYRDGVDFVFIDSPVFHAVASNIYGGTREVWMFWLLTCTRILWTVTLLFCGVHAFWHGNSADCKFGCLWEWTLSDFLQEVLNRMILFCKAAVEVTFRLPVQANWLIGRDGQIEMLSVMYPAPSHHVSWHFRFLRCL